MIKHVLAVLCSAAIALSSSYAVAQDFRFGQPFEGVSIKAGFSLKFGETKRDERGPQFRLAVEAGSQHGVGVLADDRVYRAASLTGLQWDMGEQLRVNLGGLDAYRYDHGESMFMPRYNADGEREEMSCYLLCIGLVVLLVGGAIWGIVEATDNDNGNRTRRTSGNDKDKVVIEIN